MAFYIFQFKTVCYWHIEIQLIFFIETLFSSIEIKLTYNIIVDKGIQYDLIYVYIAK